MIGRTSRRARAARLTGLALFAALSAGPAAAQSCRLALSLALDVSSSVDTDEYRLQAQGLAEALTDPDVVAAFLAVPGQSVALHVYEWSGRQQQEVRLDWTDITSADDLAATAARFAGMGRSYSEFPTALGYALGFGSRALERRPDCARHTLDVSGDGTNNDGFAPELAHREFPFESVTVNGLVIGETRETLRRYYQRFVIHGPGAFVEIAEDYSDFGRAMRRKLLRELGTGAVSALPPSPGQATR